MSAVDVSGAVKAFDDHVVLDGLDFEVPAGQFVALLGRSGCGKTTLLRVLSGLEELDDGSVTVPAARSVVFQEPRLLPWMKVWRNVVLGLPERRDRRRADAALSEVGLTARATAWPVTLSGGEAQRVALARSLVREPALLLLDEPFAALDVLTRIRMHDLVRELCQKHQPAAVFVTHDVDEAILLADRIVILRDGRIVRDLLVDVGHPRHRADPRFNSLRVDLLAELGVAPDPLEDEG